MKGCKILQKIGGFSFLVKPTCSPPDTNTISFNISLKTWRRQRLATGKICFFAVYPVLLFVSGDFIV